MQKTLIGTGLILLAANEVAPTGDWGPIGNLGTVGLVGALLWYVVTKLLPKIAEGMTKALDANTKAIDNMAQALTELRIHCASRMQDDEEG